MSQGFLITRPALDAEPFASEVAALGYEVLLDPVFDIAFYQGPAIDLSDVQGLLITSANGVRAFAVRMGATTKGVWGDLPVWAVGDSSAREAVALGFADVRSAGGDVEDLARLVAAEADPAQGALLHPAASKVAGDLQGELTRRGYRYRREILYDAKASEALKQTTLDALKNGKIKAAAFFSPRSAKLFCALAEKAGVTDDLAACQAYCLSPAVAEKLAGSSWLSVAVAAAPTRESLLALIPALNPRAK